MKATAVEQERLGAVGTVIRQNLQFKVASDVVARAIQFAFVVIAARRLGVQEFGIYSYALALGFVLAQFCDFGLQIFVTRELARAPADGSRILGTALATKLVLGAIGFAALFALVLTRNDLAEAEVIIVLALGAILTSFVEFFNYGFRGYQRLEFEGALNILARLLGPGLSIVALLLGASLRLVAWNLLLANLAATALGYYWLQRYFARPSFHFRREWLGFLLRETLPLGLAIVFSGIYVRSGVLLLQALHSTAAVGWLNAAQRLTEPLQILPAMGLAAVFPAFAGERRTRWRRALGWKTVRLLLLLAASLALGGWLGAGIIVNTLYGTAYAPTVDVLRWLVLALIPMFLNYALTHFMIALGRQWFNALFMFVMMIGNLILNLLLIPSMAAAGAALAIFISELALLLMCALALAHTPLWRGEVNGQERNASALAPDSLA